MGVSDRFPRHGRPVLKSKRWQALRLEIIERDFARCCDCGAMRRLEVHHVLSVRDRPDLAFDPANLKTLCAGCHTKITRIECGFPPPDPRREAWRGAVQELETPKKRTVKCSNP